MATKDERPTLLSKMAMFVRNPTKDWSELDSPEPEQESGYDKQALKAMIERKRQNDFVRKREFDQLRKLRNRDGAAMGALARPSVFQSSMATDPDGRAVTLKKIDEIEAQMSKQWWKGKQESAMAGKEPGFPVAKRPPVPEDNTGQSELNTMASAVGFEPTERANLSSVPATRSVADFEATEMGQPGNAQLSPEQPADPRSAMAEAKGPAPRVPAPNYDGAEVGFSTSKLFAIEVDELATDPELVEAAIRFATGDDAGAETGLVDALRGMAIQPDAGLSWAAALLDLYRATQNRSGFDDAVREFGFFFDRIAPVWSAIGDGGEPQVAEIGIADPESVASGAIWDSPAELTAQAMEDLREAMSSRPPPWHVDWTQLTHIDPDAMSLLAGLFTSLCAEEVGLRFSGSERLVAALRAMTPSGDRSVEGDWWVVRLTALRAMHLQDEFELAALDFCVTFEVAPPAWEEPRCEYEAVQIAIRSAQGGAPSQRRSVSGALPGTAALEAGAAIQLELRGQLIGDATQALAGMERKDRGGERITVSCAGLVRVDFSAAGSILNWVATRQSEGCLVQFRDVHRLVAAFFNVIGINEHSRVVPRPI